MKKNILLLLFFSTIILFSCSQDPQVRIVNNFGISAEVNFIGSQDFGEVKASATSGYKSIPSGDYGVQAQTVYAGYYYKCNISGKNSKQTLTLSVANNTSGHVNGDMVFTLTQDK